jgi:hypothetical protein
VIELNAVRIKLLGKRVLISQVSQELPILKVVGQAGTDGSVAFWIPLRIPSTSSGKGPPVGTVLLCDRVPESEVLGIESTSPLEYRGVEQGRPLFPVGRLKNDEPIRFVGAKNRFVASRIGSGWIGVFEDGGVGSVGLEFSKGLIGNRDVVFRGAVESMEGERRFPPMNTVITFRVASKARVAFSIQFSIRKVDVDGLVVHPVEIAVLENAVVSTASPFPGSVVDDDYFAGDWMVETQGYIAFEFLYQVVVNEELASGTDVNGVSE